MGTKTISGKGFVYIVDDDPAVRESISLLVRSAGFEVIPCASIDEFQNKYHPQQLCCLVLDIRLPDTSGLSLQDRLSSTSPSIPIIFVTGYGDVQTAVRAMRMGAVDFLEKPFCEKLLLERVSEAMEKAALGHVRADADRRLVTLTEREAEILEFIVRGFSTKEIAAEIFRSTKTIEAHRRSIMRKLDVSNLAEMVRIAMSATVPIGVG